MKINYKSLALRDIEEKRTYLADTLKNPPAAQRLAASILRAVSLLAGNPRMDAMLNSKFEVDTNLRYIIVSRQLVFYRIVDDGYISVTRVLDGRQGYMAILFAEQSGPRSGFLPGREFVLFRRVITAHFLRGLLQVGVPQIHQPQLLPGVLSHVRNVGLRRLLRRYGTAFHRLGLGRRGRVFGVRLVLPSGLFLPPGPFNRLYYG